MAHLAGMAGSWAGSGGERWLFVAKALLAAFSALWLAFRLGLDSPTTAMTTTFILALPSSGMVLEKAFYRLLGTVIGCASALLLVAAFPQQAPLTFIGLALWIAACTCGAAMYRNQQSYSFVLAGYTAAMIAIPALDHPAAVFALAVTRVVEVSLGVICATVVHDALLPRHQSAQVMRTVQARYLHFLDFCRGALEHKTAPAETELAHLRFAADIAALESGRAAAFFEAAHARAHTRQLHAFNTAFMAALTTFYTLHRLTHRLRQDAASPVPMLIEPLLARLAQALTQALAQPLAYTPAHGEALQGAAPDDLQSALAADIATARASVHDGSSASPHRVDVETAIELLERFARQLGEFAAVYHGLAQRKRMQINEPRAYTPKTPPAIVLASGFRAATALLTVAAVWYWMAWPYAVNAVLMTAIFCALASSSPRPTAMIKQVMTGFLIAWPLSFITEFFLVMPSGGYPMLVLAAAPLFAGGAWLISDPRRAGVGIGICLFSAQVIAPANLAHYDVAAFLNTTLAMPLGVALAWAIFAVVLPGHTMGHKDHVAAALWREALATCTAPLHWPLARLTKLPLASVAPVPLAKLPLPWRCGTPRVAAVRHRFDNRVRDLLSQLNAAAGPTPSEAERAVVRQGLTLLELGHSVLELRALIDDAGHAADPLARSALRDCVSALAAYFRAPTQQRCATAVAAVLRAGATVRAALPAAQPEPSPLPAAALQGAAPAAPRPAASGPAASSRAARLRTALTDLHSIHTCLLDQLPQSSTGAPHAS
ncbi:fusaric acid resistance protein [Massilia sp. Root418]|nr:fusaric acid resistance protein [Massilia sp. Root418]